MKKPGLHEFQVRAISYALKNPYCILGLSPGLGKTRCALEVREKIQAKCLIICPSYLIDNWIKEIRKWIGESAEITTFKRGKDIKPLIAGEYVITSYDLIQKAEQLFEWAELVIIDEAHAIKSMKAKRTQFIHKNIYENSIKRVLLLTGTPIKNRVQEFYSLLALCFYRPDIAESDFLEKYPSEIDFADYFSNREEYQMEINFRTITVLKWTGLRNVEELRGYLKDKYIRIRSEDVLDLPPIIYKEFQTSDDDDEDLKRAFDSYFIEDEGEIKQFEREQRTGSVLPEHKAMAALKKVPFTIKYATDLLEEVDQLLIYSDHIQSAEEIAKAFKVPALTGKMPAQKRSELADRFQAGEGNVLVCTIGSMKEGKDLYRANHLIFNDLPWVVGDITQVIHRIQRIGQKGSCFIHKIYGSPQDAHISEVLEEKRQVIERAT